MALSRWLRLPNSAGVRSPLRPQAGKRQRDGFFFQHQLNNPKFAQLMRGISD